MVRLALAAVFCHCPRDVGSREPCRNLALSVYIRKCKVFLGALGEVVHVDFLVDLDIILSHALPSWCMTRGCLVDGQERLETLDDTRIHDFMLAVIICFFLAFVFGGSWHPRIGCAFASKGAKKEGGRVVDGYVTI